ncbi:MAG: L-serine ammonia-lyase, iron-sulfur-dependent, subunit alpha [Bacteroidales bacterium]|nr:L-serine ammonia-lyase, iron-sulfur-dependent, subunit alpha [Bacteroidales bacterium]HOY38458.1 L-serine ammonia-lyase, iron-sulfur-dependent, subunit alpha [Bacteroidales bacterium]
MNNKRNGMQEKLGLNDAAKFRKVMPERYFSVTDPEDFRQHEVFLNKFEKAGNQACLYHYKGDIEEFVFHEYNTVKLREQIAIATKTLHANELLYRIFPNKQTGFMLTSIYKDIMLSDRSVEFNPPVFSNEESLFFDSGRLKTHIICNYSQQNRIFEIKCINVAHKTMLSNLWETIEMHEINVDFTEVWRIKNVSAKVNSFYCITLHFASDYCLEEIESVRMDFLRYIQHYTVPMSIFDLVGPSMVGPSSSHTAGANRIGQIARSIIAAKLTQGETIKDISVKLLGSFRDTGVGHRTPAAIAGGLWGLATDHPDMLSHGDPEFLCENGIVIAGQKLHFLGFLKGEIDEEVKYQADNNMNIAEIIFNTDIKPYTITGFSIGGGNVEIRYFNTPLAKPINGKTDFYLNGDTIVDVQNYNGTLPVIQSIFGKSQPESNYIMPFNTFEELLTHSDETSMSIDEIALQVERNLQQCSEEYILQQMKYYFNIMLQSAGDGVLSKELSMLKLSGDDAYKIYSLIDKSPLFCNIYGRAVAYATAVNELNAKSGVIVACPTAGSCGILPGVLKSYCEFKQAEEDAMLRSLIVAGFLGMLLFNDVTTAGADYGCQAEVGAAAAMAASALCYLENGNSYQIVNAFTLAIKNSLGLICDPIAGLVEVPCVKRNGIYSSVAISAALMALSGVKSYVSPDEVILTMREVGERINSDYKETARGGLARTRDGKHVEKLFESEVKKFFN